MKKPDVYRASDYAGVSTKDFTAYYGYEEIDENEEWCFVAKFDDIEIRIPFSRLGARDQFDCYECLLNGIAWCFLNMS